MYKGKKLIHTHTHTHSEKQQQARQKQSAIENVIIKFLTFVNLYTRKETGKRKDKKRCP